MFNDGLVGVNNERPRIAIKLSTSDKVLEVIALLTLITIWIYVIYNYASLPEIINTHFDANGKPNGSGEKYYIFGLPGVATLLYTMLTIVNKFPHTMNFTEEITEHNALVEYTKATKMMRLLKTIVVFVFGYACFQTIGNINVSPWFLPLFIISILSPILYYNLKKR